MQGLKTYFVIIIISICNTTINAQAPSGKWFLVEEGDTSVLELRKDSVFFLISKSNGLHLGGLNTYSPEISDEDSLFLDYKYVCDLSTFPHHLILTGYYANTDSIDFVIPTYFEFWEDGSLVLFIHDLGILSPDEDDIEHSIAAFYKNIDIAKNNYEEALIFKPRK